MELLDRSVYLCIVSVLTALSIYLSSSIPTHLSIHLWFCVCVYMCVCVQKFLFLWDGWRKAQLLSHVAIVWHPSLYLCIYVLSGYLFIHPSLYVCTYVSKYLSMYHLFIHPLIPSVYLSSIIHILFDWDLCTWGVLMNRGHSEEPLGFTDGELQREKETWAFSSLTLGNSFLLFSKHHHVFPDYLLNLPGHSTPPSTF